MRVYYVYLYIIYRCGRGPAIRRDVPIIHKRREDDQIYFF